MANAYSDGVRYGYIEFVDHIPANKEERPKVLALVGNIRLNCLISPASRQRTYWMYLP